MLIQLALDMVAKVQSSEIIGFLNWYFEEVTPIFKSKTNQTTVAVKIEPLVNWFLKKRSFCSDYEAVTKTEETIVGKNIVA